MPKLEDLVPEQRFVGLFVGPSGSGKTCAEISFRISGNNNPIEVIDFDGRIGGALGATWITKDHKSLITYNYYPPRDKSFIDKINQKLEAILIAGNVGQVVPQTLILDSLTSETFAALSFSMPLTHKAGEKGKFIGPVQMAGPEDYGVESTVTYSILSFLRSVRVNNIIVSAHVVPTYSKLDPNDPYSPSVESGEKLSLRDKISANVGIYFDHVFRFDKRMIGDKEHFYVRFRGDLARTSYPWLPEGEHDITGKNFYEFMYSFRKEQ